MGIVFVIFILLYILFVYVLYVYVLTICNTCHYVKDQSHVVMNAIKAIPFHGCGWPVVTLRPYIIKLGMFVVYVYLLM